MFCAGGRFLTVGNFINMNMSEVVRLELEETRDFQSLQTNPIKMYNKDGSEKKLKQSKKNQNNNDTSQQTNAQ